MNAKMRKNKGPFSIIRDADVRDRFMSDLNALVEASPFVLVACAIRKDRHLARYAGPDNPYHLALGFGLERLYLELYARGCREGRTYVLFEKRGPKEDAELELEFRRIRDGGNYLRLELPFEAILCDKTCNSSRLQMADLVARPYRPQDSRPGATEPRL
jgi:hypothetical protein